VDILDAYSEPFDTGVEAEAGAEEASAGATQSIKSLEIPIIIVVE